MDLDIDFNSQARAAYMKLNPRGTVPTFDIGGQVLIGFSPPAIRRALATARAR